MLATSAKWVRAITDRLRLQGMLAVTLDLTTPGIYEGIQTSAPQLDEISNSGDVFDRHLEPFQKNFTLERDRTRADGTFFVPNTQVVNNEQIVPQFTPGLPRTFEVLLAGVFDVPQVQITWDEITNSYATHFTITGYNVLGEVINIVEVLGNTELQTSTPVLFEDCYRLSITILQVHPAGWRARISQIGLGVLIEFREHERILRASQHRAGSLISSRVPSDTAELELNNLDIYFDPLFYSGYVKHLSQRQQLAWQWGTTALDKEKLWLVPQKYFLSSWQVPSDGTGFTLKCGSRLDFLTSDFRGDIWTGQSRTFWDLVNFILEQSDIIKLEDEPNPWIMPEFFKELTTTAPTPIKATKELLKDIADATATVLDIDPLTAFIRFRPLTRLSNVFENAQISSNTFDPVSNFANVFNAELLDTVRNFTVERDRAQANGTFYVLGATVPEELITPQFLPGQPTVFNIQLQAVYNVPTIILDWDLDTNSWPTSFQIAGYDSSGSLVDTLLVEGNDSVTSVVDLFFLGVYRLEVTTIEWYPSTWRARLTRIRTATRQLTKAHSINFAPLIEIDDPIKYLRVNINGYTRAAEELENIAALDLWLANSQEVIVPFGKLYEASSLEITASNGVISDVQATTGQVTFTLTGVGVTKVEVKGYAIVQSTYAQPGFEDQVIASGATIVQSNWAVTSPELAARCQEHLLHVLLGRQRFTTDYQGFPELELYDYLEQTSKFGTVHTYVSELELEFNGGFSGKVVSRIVDHSED